MYKSYENKKIQKSIYEILTIALKDKKFRYFFVAGIVICVLGGVFEVFFIFYVSALLGTGTESIDSQLRIEGIPPNTLFLLLVFLATSLKFIIQAISGYIAYLAGCFLGKIGLETMRITEYEKILSIGKVAGVNNLINRINIFCNSFLLNLLLLIQSCAGIALIGVYLLYIEVFEIEAYLLPPVIFYLLWLGSKKITSNLSEKVSTANAKAATNVISYFENYASIRTYNVSEALNRRFSSDFRILRSNQFLIQLVASSPKFVLEGVALIIFGTVVLSSSSKITGDTAGINNITLMLAIVIIRAAPLIGNIVSAFIQIGASNVDINRLANFFNEINNQYPEHISKNHLQSKIEKEKVAYSTVGYNEKSLALQFNNVSFKYKQSTDEIIRNLNFTVKKGEFFGLKGASGAGKSTVVHLICGLLAPTRGTIKYGSSIKFDTKTGAQGVAIVEQNVMLFPESLLYNITLNAISSEKDIDRVKEILKRVNLEEFTTENSLRTIIGDGARQISGGQRQRIGLARALFSDAKIIVLDEFTSALDNVSENICVEVVSKLRGRVTTVIVSHREAPLLLCDDIIELRN